MEVVNPMSISEQEIESFWIPEVASILMSTDAEVYVTVVTLSIVWDVECVIAVVESPLTSMVTQYLPAEMVLKAIVVPLDQSEFNSYLLLLFSKTRCTLPRTLFGLLSEYPRVKVMLQFLDTSRYTLSLSVILTNADWVTILSPSSNFFVWIPNTAYLKASAWSQILCNTPSEYIASSNPISRSFSDWTMTLWC